MRATVREADVAARWGGEEFALVLPGTGSEGGALLAERIRGDLRVTQACRRPTAPTVRITGQLRRRLVPGER